MICHTAADPEAYPELPSEVESNLSCQGWQMFLHFSPVIGWQLHGTLPIGASCLVPPPQILNFLLRDHRVQGGQHQDRPAHVPQEDPWLQAGQHQVHGLGKWSTYNLQYFWNLTSLSDFVICFGCIFWNLMHLTHVSKRPCFICLSVVVVLALVCTF